MGSAGVAAELVAERQGGDLALLERRTVADVGRRVRLVLGEAQLPQITQRPHDLLLPGAGLIRGGVHVDRRVRQIDIARAHAVAGRIEDVAVALLDRDRELLLGPGFQLAHLGLLVLGQVDQLLWLLELPQGQPVVGLPPHVILAGIVSDREYQVVAERPQSGALGTLARIDSVDEFGNVFDGTPDSHRVVGQNDELRPAAADIVGDVERPLREWHRVEGLAVEDLPDAVVQLGPRFPRIHVPFLAPDDLAEGSLRRESASGRPADRRGRRIRR